MLSLVRPGRAVPGTRAGLVLAAVPLLLLPACGTVPTSTSSAPGSASPGASSTVEPDQSGPSDDACEYTVTGTPARPVQPPSPTDIARSGTVSYVVHLTKGDVTLHLDRAKAPCTVHSFESLVAQKFYDATTCPRLADSGISILQCGDPTGTTSGGPGYTFPDELDGTETYPKGTVAMANAGPNTNGSQFFLVWDDSDLDPSYTVFGTYEEDSRHAIASIASQGEDGSNGAGDGKPIEPADITSITKAS